MNYGEVWWCDLPEPDRRRPAVIVTRQSAINILTWVTVAPITSTIRDVPSYVALSIDDGLFGDCVVNCDALLTIPKESVRRPITRLSTNKLTEVQAAIRFALDV